MAPYFMEVRDPDNKTNPTPRHAGRDYIILEEIAKALNFSINVLPYTDLNNVSFQSGSIAFNHQFCIEL